jgi:hypothetical protein
MPVPLDEFPIHQLPLSLEHVGSSDRNFYDRSYFNAQDRSDELFLVTGFGMYPNLGVKDAFALLRLGDRQHSVRFSDALGHDRMDQRVGDYRIEVLEPLRRIRIVCDGDDLGLGLDLTFEGSFPAIHEQPHQLRAGSRAILDASRFAQVGTWEGVIRAPGRTIAVARDTWVGTRDRSWGIRPVGESEPPGRRAEEAGSGGFWWVYMPLRFEEFAIVLIVQEQPDGFRTLNDANRVWPDGRIEQLGWPRIRIRYRSGTRHAEHASIHCTTPDGKPLVIEVDTLTFAGLNVGAGYGGDPDWAHGQWKGRSWRAGAVYDMNDPAVRARVPFCVVDHVARASCDGLEGWGLFEHGTFGRHDPSGFADYGSVAP